MPEIALAKIRPDAPLDKVCLLGCGITTGIGAVLNTAKVHPGASVAVFGLGGIGLSVVQGAVMAGAGRIIGIDINPKKFALARQLGATDVLDAGDASPNVAEALVEMTDGGVDFSFECIGNVEVMNQALMCCHKGWGQSHHHRRRRRRRGDPRAARSCWSPAAPGAAPPSAARAVARSCRSTSTGTMSGRIKLDEFITHTMPLEHINDAFDLMHRGREHPQRGAVRVVAAGSERARARQGAPLHTTL